ncbi:MAG: hypothetical protein Q9208_006130 [Pyrenodesmia sp. 3 TL-2023]
MIISPALAALALASSTSTPMKTPSLDDSPGVCYDSSHAAYRPSMDDCAAIINHQIAVAPLVAQEIIFSRNPTHSQFRLPHTWATTQNDCLVTIDIPPFPHHRGHEQSEQASMADIKQAAFNVLIACVLRADRLGGFATAGRQQRLVVSITGAVRAEAQRQDELDEDAEKAETTHGTARGWEG